MYSLVVFFHLFSSLFVQVQQTPKRKPPGSTNGPWILAVFTFLHNRCETLTFSPLEQLISVPTSDCFSRGGRCLESCVLSLSRSLSSQSASQLCLLCLCMSFILHSSLLCFLQTPSCLFPLSLFLSPPLSLSLALSGGGVATADWCRWSGSLQTAGGRGGSVWGAQRTTGWLILSFLSLFLYLSSTCT